MTHAVPRVLIVEDERIIARDLQQQLVDMGYDAGQVASSMGVAVQLAAEDRPDLVLMDVRIRGQLDGIATAAILRERFDVPIVFLTAHSDLATIARANRTRPHAYLCKPVKPAELRSAIDLALQHHRIERELRVLADRLQAERDRFAALHAQFETTLEHVSCGVAITDRAGCVLHINHRLLAMFECARTPVDAQGAYLETLLFGDGSPVIDRERIRAEGRDIASAAARPSRAPFALADGRWLRRDHATARMAGTDAGHVWCFHDVSDHEQERSGLLELVQRDGLTGAVSRRGLEDAARTWLSRGATFALYFLDLDGFKQVNDICGHEAGDAVLREVAQRLSDGTRREDVVARLAGDEFVVLAHGVGPSVAESLGRTLAAELSFDRLHQGVALRVGASLGYATAPSEGGDLDTLLRIADQRMYASKRDKKRTSLSRVG